METAEKIIQWRRELHRHPEEGWTEFWTTGFVARQLADMGLAPRVGQEVIDPAARMGLPAPEVEARARQRALAEGLEPYWLERMGRTTGLVADVGPSDAPLALVLRCDMDTLPLMEAQEASHRPVREGFVSRHEGLCHACAHDGHMALGLGLAALLTAPDAAPLRRRVRLLFQPAEELGLGAKAMVDAGLLADVSAAIGAHNNPNYAPGQIAVGPDPMMAGCVKFHVTLHAAGSHAGYPHKGTGPIEALATMILALQTIVSRNVSPFHPLVLSITELHGGHVWNVVPDKASFQGTVRYFHKSDGELVEKRFKQQVQSIAAGYGITTDIDWDDFQNPLVSDMELSKIVADNVRDYAQLEPIHPSMAGEDFCDFMPVTMPVFAFIGSNGEKGCPDWHSPHFVGLDESLQAGVEFYANAALTVLNELS